MKHLRIIGRLKSGFRPLAVCSLLSSFLFAISAPGLRAQAALAPAAAPATAAGATKILQPVTAPGGAAAALLGGGNESEKGDRKNARATFVLNRDFRVEKFPVVAGGAEIVTIFVKLPGLADSPEASASAEEMPLVSVLRDTLGDERVENDRLRYVWMLTYTKPSFGQKIASAVPFLYTRTTNHENVGDSPPPPIIDLSPGKGKLWNKVFWTVFQNMVLNDFGFPVKASYRQYRENRANYRKSSVARALAVMSLYEAVEGEKILSETEIRDVQARLLLSDKFFGSEVSPEQLERVYQKNLARVRDLRGHNWELLRQTTEAQGLYFEPLEMPDGSATHALVWVAAEDLAPGAPESREKKFDARFLNLKNPWRDESLLKWRGHTETRWFDENNRPADPDAPGAAPKRMIPLALYGLDFPKIPILLVDFRDGQNAKKREMSRRVLDDLMKNFLSKRSFGDVPYFVGRYVYDFVTGRRGMDVNQPSRFQSYSQLKLLLALNASLEPGFRDEIAARLESATLNPLENDLRAEVKLARRQYDNLINYASRADGGGLAARLEKDRRREMEAIKHGAGTRALHTLGRVFSLGLYKHREEFTPGLRAEMDLRRQLEYHERYLREVARRSAKPEVDSDLAAVKRSLAFISMNGTRAAAGTARAVAKIFSITDDEATRALALSGLYRINDRAAKKELFAIYENRNLDTRWRDLSVNYLRLAVREGQRAPSSAKKVIKIDGE